MFRGSLDNSPTKGGGSNEASNNLSSHHSNQQQPINREHIIPPDEVEPKIATNATIFGERKIGNDGKKDPPNLSQHSAQKRRKVVSQIGENEFGSTTHDFHEPQTAHEKKRRNKGVIEIKLDSAAFADRRPLATASGPGANPLAPP